MKRCFVDIRCTNAKMLQKKSIIRLYHEIYVLDKYSPERTFFINNSSGEAYLLDIFNPKFFKIFCYPQMKEYVSLIAIKRCFEI